MPTQRRPRGRGRPAADRDEVPESGPRPCPPCRGSGTVISNLGGSANRIACPWCAGSGLFDPERNAQEAAAAARAGGGEAQSAGDGPGPAPEPAGESGSAGD
jgi:DnaJ-class molecular chaperone